jgi:hypothetical protein
MFGTVNENGVWNMCTDEELMNVCVENKIHLRNQERKIQMVRTCRKSCEEGV